MGFLINKVAINNSSFDLAPLHFDTNNIFTVLIGKNGSGKSRILSSIAHLFCSIDIGKKLVRRDSYNYRRDSSYPENFQCSYYNNDVNTIVHIAERRIFGVREAISTLEKKQILPESLICISTSPFDRFPTEREYYSPMRKKNNEEFYFYYGIKDKGYGNPVVILLEKIIFLLSSKTQENQKTAFVKTLYFLNYQPRIKAIFRLKTSIDKLIINMQSLSPDDFLSYILTITKTSKSYYEKYQGIDYNSICNAIYSLQNEIDLGLYGRYIDINVDYSGNTENYRSYETISDIKILSDLNILSLHDVILYPEDNGVYYQHYTGEYQQGRSLYDASSGEQCILLSTLSIASAIKNNALILIDEPEISLHPEWQETYIELLMQIFNNHNGCHFIIATHSPQIISRLNNENCYITQTENGELKTAKEYIDKSADFQLARLFHTPGKENEYLRRLSVNILTKISKGIQLSHENLRDIEILMNAHNKLDPDDTVKTLIDLIIKARSLKND